MRLSIRHWLAERHIELAQLGQDNAQLAGIAFRIAQDMEVKSLNPFAISVLTEVLELPLTVAWQVAPILSQLTVGLLRILSRKKPLRRSEGTWLSFQVAYLNALQGILEQEAQLRRPWVNRAQVPASPNIDEPLVDPQLIALLKTLRPGRLSDSQAEQALSSVANSFLVQQMNNLAIAWFVANGAEETEAKLLTQRLSNGLAGHLLKVIAENALPLAQLQKFVRLGHLSNTLNTPVDEDEEEEEFSTPQLTLDLDREYYRAELSLSLSEPLFAEPFSLKEIYVSLNGRRLPTTLGQENRERRRKQDLDAAYLAAASSPPTDLMAWVMAQLNDKNSIAVIEADGGCGKTSFCQMLAARVAQELYPQWMPVIIRLRDVTLGQSLEQTLETAFPVGRFTDTDGWFSRSSPPCLLILDGLNELPRSPQTERHLWTFMDQVMRFHTHKSGSNSPRHKIILTSRPVTLDGVLARKYRHSSLPPLQSRLQRIAIEPMAKEEFRKWFLQWAKLQSKSIAQSYFNFLKHGGVFQPQSPNPDLVALLTRPLMLYLVGILHRDALIDDRIFKMSPAEVKFEIYDRIRRWLLGEPTSGSGPPLELIREGFSHAGRSLEAIANLLEGRSPQQLRRQMQGTALTILQTGQNQVTQTVIQNRFQNQETTPESFTQPLPTFFFRTQPRDKAGDWVKSSPRQASASQKAASAPFSIEFSHPSLGDYLAAEEIALQLKALTQKLPNQYGEVSFVIDSSLHLAEHLYQLLGYGLLSPQIEELVIERLRREQQRNADAFSFPVLFQRLYRFYRAYCRGRWFDEGVAHRVHEQLRDLNNPLNTLQIDATVGLNVFLVLCSAAREANLPFWPCGNPEISQEFDADQLLSFMGRTVALSPTTFWQRARRSLAQIHLPQACLNRVMLAEANLVHADLSTAELSGINLAAANLQQANLAWASLVGANLADADLKGAQLEGANLLGADLRGANLTSANLTNACLVDAQLDEPNKEFAVKSGAFFSWDEFQSYYQSLVVSPFVKTIEEEHLFEDDPMIFIESAEGELMLPTIYSQGSDRYDGETEQFDRDRLNAQATVSETEQYAGETAQLDEWVTEAPVSDTEQYSGDTQQLDEMGQHPSVSDTEQYAGETAQVNEWEFSESETEEEQLEAGAEQETGVFHEDTIMLDEEDDY
ncbi:pentapeptide repeat-containing protein [Coleofasciculus sp.]|uniref:pentapeptide repeat-containing protein n=1 Tax=Coleofasciculus sp. TaxID=3100458 RepID=UPI003A34F5E3